MKKLPALCIMMFCLVVQIYPDEKYIEYVNSDALFKLKYKGNAIFKENSYAYARNNAHALTLFVEQIKFINEDARPGDTKKDSLIQYSNSIKGILTEDPYRIGSCINDSILSYAFFISPQDPSVYTNLIARFYNNGYKISIIFEAYLSHEHFLTHYPAYIDNRYFNWKNFDKVVDFFNLIKAGKADPEIQEWYNDFLELIDSIEVTKNYFRPTVNRLSFRSEEGKTGGIIRTLGPNDRFEIIEYGIEETINGVQGKWARIITDQGELGWCFDAYIAQVE